MVEISKEELEGLKKHLLSMEDVINGNGLELYYSACTYQHKRLRRLLDDLTTEYNSLYDLFDKWYNRSK